MFSNTRKGVHEYSHRCRERDSLCLRATVEGDAHAPDYYYVGSTADIQTRIAQHTGAIPGGAKWTALHPPISVIDVVPCSTAFQAACVETALWALLAGKCKDFNRVRGAKFCMCTELRYAPIGWGPSGKEVCHVDDDSKKRTLDDAEYPLAKRAEK